MEDGIVGEGDAATVDILILDGPKADPRTRCTQTEETSHLTLIFPFFHRMLFHGLETIGRA